MSKSMLILETPKSCGKCKVSTHFCPTFVNECFIRCPFILMPSALGENNKYYKEVHPQCPLKDTSELLETLGNQDIEFHTVEDNTIHHGYFIYEEDYNKLKKALGDKDEG